MYVCMCVCVCGRHRGFGVYTVDSGRTESGLVAVVWGKRRGGVNWLLMVTQEVESTSIEGCMPLDVILANGHRRASSNGKINVFCCSSKRHTTGPNSFLPRSRC